MESCGSKSRALPLATPSRALFTWLRRHRVRKHQPPDRVVWWVGDVLIFSPLKSG